MKTLRYAIEAFFLHILLFIFSVLPMDKASAFGGWLARIIGPRLGASKKAYKNLNRAFPDMNKREQIQIVTNMWDNLGRVTAEYPHLEQIAKGRITVKNPELMDQQAPIVFISAHIANWEVLLPNLYINHNLQAHGLYRAPNNPWTDKLLSRLRSLNGMITSFPKSKKGALSLLRAIKNGQNIALLIDQKYNEGLPVPFFGSDAMTSPAFFDMAQKFKAPIIAVQLKRLKGVHFEITLHDLSSIKEYPVEEALVQTHIILENWIKEEPAQWLWLHRRWPKDSK